jgi:hypothetical protein
MASSPTKLTRLNLLLPDGSVIRREPNSPVIVRLSPDSARAAGHGARKAKRPAMAGAMVAVAAASAHPVPAWAVTCERVLSDVMRNADVRRYLAEPVDADTFPGFARLAERDEHAWCLNEVTRRLKDMEYKGLMDFRTDVVSLCTAVQSFFGDDSAPGTAAGFAKTALAESCARNWRPASETERRTSTDFDRETAMETIYGAMELLDDDDVRDEISDIILRTSNTMDVDGMADFDLQELDDDTLKLLLAKVSG